MTLNLIHLRCNAEGTQEAEDEGVPLDAGGGVATVVRGLHEMCVIRVQGERTHT
jgi:hypothetical protein